MGGSPARSLTAALAFVVAAAGCAGQGSSESTRIQRATADVANVAGPATVSLADIHRSVPSTATIGSSDPTTPAVENAGAKDSGLRGSVPSLVARAIVSEIAAYHRPGGRHLASFTTPGPYGEPKVFLVREARDRWLRVLLPMRPNGVGGWIRRADVRLSRHRFAARVDLSERRLTAFRGSNVILRRSVAIGLPQSPTPTGPFYITVVARAPDPTGPYGPLALGLSGFSEVYTEFNGSNGQIAIHGTNAPDLIGQAASSGCVRMRNDDVVRLAQHLRLGTPVRIVP